MTPILTTPRLLLRELTLADLDFVAEMLAHPEVMRYYPRCFSREEARSWIERQLGRYEQYGHGLWLVASRESGQPVGQVGVIPQEVEGELHPEIGYLLHRPFWRQGLASEAAQACREYAFTTLAKPHVISLIRPENEPSQRVAHKNGMTIWKRTLFKEFIHDVWRVERPGAMSGPKG